MSAAVHAMPAQPSTLAVTNCETRSRSSSARSGATLPAKDVKVCEGGRAQARACEVPASVGMTETLSGYHNMGMVPGRRGKLVQHAHGIVGQVAVNP